MSSEVKKGTNNKSKTNPQTKSFHQHFHLKSGLLMQCTCRRSRENVTAATKAFFQCKKQRITQILGYTREELMEESHTEEKQRNTFIFTLHLFEMTIRLSVISNSTFFNDDTLTLIPKLVKWKGGNSWPAAFRQLT